MRKKLSTKIFLIKVELKTYDLLLDYPDPENPNLIHIFNGTEEIFRSHFKEETLHAGDNHTNFVDSFLAFSPAGEASGNVVYVNYGQEEDFQLITDPESEFYTNVTGKICLVRYGQIFRGNQAQNSERHGCSAMVLFSDPGTVPI